MKGHKAATPVAEFGERVFVRAPRTEDKPKNLRTAGKRAPGSDLRCAAQKT